MRRPRVNVYMDREHDIRLSEIAAMRGLSKSAIVEAAVMSFLSPEGADRREAAIAKRLDKLSNQYERLTRDQTILMETIALHVRYQLSVTAPVPESFQDAARAQGKARFAQFVEQLAKHLQRGNSLVKELSEEIYPNTEQFFGDARPTGSHPKGST